MIAVKKAKEYPRIFGVSINFLVDFSTGNNLLVLMGRYKFKGLSGLI